MSFFGTRRQSEPALRPPADVPPRLDPPQPPSEIPQPVGFETVLGTNSVLEGTLRSAANVRLDGTFTGTLEIGGNVLIGETAKITADVNARNISIAGAVRGNVTGKKVQLLRTGRVWGDIHAQALTTEEGAFIDGKIAMVGHALSPVMSEPEAPAAPESFAEQAPEPDPAMTPNPYDEPHEPDRIIPELEPVGLGAVEEGTEPGEHAEDGVFGRTELVPTSNPAEAEFHEMNEPEFSETADTPSESPAEEIGPDDPRAPDAPQG